MDASQLRASGRLIRAKPQRDYDMDRKTFISGLAAFGAMPAAAGSLLSALPAHAAGEGPDGKAQDKDWRYTADEITEAGANFFGITTEAMAKAVQHIFGDLGQPDAYIKGEEGSGAFVVGLRYGSGWLVRKTRDARRQKPLTHARNVESIHADAFADRDPGQPLRREKNYASPSNMPSLGAGLPKQLLKLPSVLPRQYQPFGLSHEEEYGTTLLKLLLPRGRHTSGAPPPCTPSRPLRSAP